MHRSAAALVALSLPSALAAQLAPTLLYSFVDTVPGGGGYIGVTQDETTLDIFVIAFSNPQSVHRFDLVGNPLSTFPTSSCTPALPSPNDITYDAGTDTLWLVDNDGGRVLQMDKQGGCLGGWTLPIAVSNPVGICHDRTTDTLFVSHTGGVMQCSTSGALLAGGFSFTPPSGSAILSGITYVPAIDHFLITQSSGTNLYEVDRTGTLISTTPLAPFGPVNLQGVYYDVATQQLLVQDNTQATTYVFDLPFCNGPVAQSGLGCFDSGGQRLVLGATGCADIGSTVTLQAIASNNPFPMLLAGGTQAQQFDLGLIGGPVGCFLFTSVEAVVSLAPVGGVATVPFGIPNDPGLSGVQVLLQAFVLDPLLAAQLPLASSNAVALSVQ